MNSVYHLPESLPADLQQMREMAAQFARGEISAARFQSFRVPQGVYEQRDTGRFMLRVRLAAGMLQPEHMRALARVAREHGDGTLHLTSRQDIQVHGVPVEEIAPALEALAAAGLSTKGGGGNTVRNIAACYLSGVCPEEAFDVDPHVVRLTGAMLPDPLNYQLPRKYKIAFSGCGRDCAGATINDLGFIARSREGVPGFAVYAGGGLGAQSAVGRQLEEFVPAEEACQVAEAVKRVFDRRGNRKNRHRARLRFLIEDLGFAEFVRLYREQREALAGAAVPPLPRLPGGTAVAEAPAEPPTEGFERWRRHHVTAQKQPGLHVVEMAPPLGVLEAGMLERLAGVVERHGEGLLRATNWQTLTLRHVPGSDLTGVHRELGFPGEPAVLRHLVTCAGASTCRLGICLSRALAQAVREALLASPLNLDGAAGEVRIHISGCPNSCGRHPVAQIGLCGAARRIEGQLVPHYLVQFGGRVEEGGTVLASGNLAIPARQVPAFLVKLLEAFEASPCYPDFDRFLAEGGRELAARLPLPEAGGGVPTDWGAAGVFTLAGRGQAECGAGPFDGIQLDLAAAGEAAEAGQRFTAAALAAHALLITRGEEASGHQQSLDLFRQLFVEAGLIDPEFRALVARAQEAAREAEPESAFVAEGEEVRALLRAVRQLYESLDASLRV